MGGAVRRQVLCRRLRRLSWPSLTPAPSPRF